MANSDMRLSVEISADPARAVKALGDLQKSVAETEVEFKKAQAEAEGMAKGLEESGGKTEALAAHFALSKKELESLAIELKSVRQEQADVSKEFGKYSSEAASAAEKTERHRSAYDSLKKEVADLGRAYKTSASETSSLEKSNKAASKSAASLGGRLQAQTQNLAANRAALQAAGVDLKNLEGEYRRLKTAADAVSNLKAARLTLDSKPLRDVEAEVRRVEEALQTLKISGDASFGEIARSTQNANAKISALRDSVGGIASPAASASLSSLAARLAAVTAGVVSLQAAFDQAKGIVETGRKFEDLGVQLKTITGSAQNAEQALSWIQEFAKNTPLSVEQVSQAFIKLKAFGLDPMNGSLQAIADQTAALGGGQEKLEGVVLALGQAWTKQKFQAEEANQLIERGVPVWDLLSKATGKSTAELIALSEKGLIGRDSIKALIDEMGRFNAGAAEAGMATLTGLLSNAQDKFDLFRKSIYEAGLGDYLKNQLGTVNAAFDAAQKSGDLARWSREISDGLISIGQAIKGAITFIRDYSGELKLLAEVVAAVKFAQLASEILSIGQAAELTEASMSGASGAVASLSAAMKITPWGLAIAGATAAGAALLSHKSAQEDHVAETQRQIEALKAENSALETTGTAMQAATASTVKLSESQASLGAASSPILQMSEAAKNLGIDLEQALSGVSGQVRDALGQYDTLRQGLERTGYAGEKAGQILLQSLNKVAEQAKTREEIALIREEILKLGQSGGDPESVAISLSKIDGAAKALVQPLQSAQQQLDKFSDAQYSSNLNVKNFYAEASQAVGAAKLLAADYASGAGSADALASAEKKAADAVRALTDEIENQKAPNDGQVDGIKKHADNQNELTGNTDTQVDSQKNLTKTQKDGADSEQNLTQKIGDGNSVKSQAISLWDQINASARAYNSTLGDIFDRYQGEAVGDAASTWRIIGQGQAFVAAQAAEYNRVLEQTNELQAAMNGNGHGLYSTFLSMGGSLDRITEATSQAYDGVQLLDSQRMSGLSSALEQVRQKLIQIREQAASAKKEQLDELDQINGNAKAIEERAYAGQKSKLAEQAQQAQASGDQKAASDLADAQRLADEIHAKKIAQIEKDSAAKKAGTNSTQGEKTVNINLSSGSTRATVTAPNDAEAKKVVLALQKAGLRAA